MTKPILGEKEILTLRKMVEPRTSKLKLKEEEIKFIRDQIKQKEETSKLEKREKEELQEEKLKVATEIKETERLEVEKHEEIPAQPIIEAPKLVKEPEKPETEIEKEVEEKPSKLKRKFKTKLEKPVIEDVRIVKMTDLWRKKPKVFSSESDAIIVTIKTPEGKKVKETFYAYIKPDGTFNIKSGRTKTPTQRKFVNFLQYYKLANNLEKYNIIEESKGWKGKPVKIDSSDKIVIPKGI